MFGCRPQFPSPKLIYDDFLRATGVAIDEHTTIPKAYAERGIAIIVCWATSCPAGSHTFGVKAFNQPLEVDVTIARHHALLKPRSAISLSALSGEM
jgi:hypothetical protein